MKHTILFVMIIVSNALYSQSLSETETKKLVSDKNFVFKANTVLPMNGKSQHLVADTYSVTIGDVMKSNLPFFGVSYSENDLEGGIILDSKNFTYNIQEEKKVWKVSIQPSDLNYTITFNFSISSNGNTCLHISDSRRQEIHFTGYIEAL